MDRAALQNMSDVENAHWWFVSRRRILAMQIRRLPRAGGNVLEVGCGGGGNLSMLGEFGDVAAVELDDELRQLATERSGLNVLKGHLPDGLPIGNDRFDIVAALDVVEHVEEDADSVTAMAEVLDVGGHLVVTVPAFRWLWSEHDDTHHHKRRYTVRELRVLMEKAGLEIVKTSYFNMFLFPLAVCVRLLRKALGIKGADDAAMPSPIVNAIFKWIFGSEEVLLRHLNFPFGLSVLCVGRRNN